MDQLSEEHLERMAERGRADRRDGCYTRWLPTERGMIEVHVPRTRTLIRQASDYAAWLMREEVMPA